VTLSEELSLINSIETAESLAASTKAIIAADPGVVRQVAGGDEHYFIE
jgi:hypothetical protein